MENSKQFRQVNQTLATFVTMVIGIAGGIAGIAATLFAMFAIPAVMGLTPFSSALYFVAPGIAIIIGPFCAIFGGWAAGRLIDRYERRPAFPRYRDNRSGGVLTLIAKIIVWMAFTVFIGTIISLVSSLSLSLYS